MRKFLHILFIAITLNAAGQDYIKEDGSLIPDNSKKTKNNIWDKLRFGGNFMILPSSYYGYKTLYIDISPMVAYKVNKRLTAGNFFVYQYYSNDFYKLSTSLYGVKPFIQFALINDIDELFNNSTDLNLGVSLIVQKPYLSIEKNLFYEGDGRKWITATLAGFTVVQKIGNRGGFYISLLWGLSGDSEYYLLEVQSNPITEIGFYF